MPVKKTPYPDRKPLRLLTLSRADIKHLYSMFTNVLKSKDFNDCFGVVAAFDYIKDGSFDAFDEQQFKDAIEDESEILRVDLVIALDRSINSAKTIGPFDTDKNAPAKLILSKEDAKIEIRHIRNDELLLNFPEEELRSCNQHLDHLQKDVIEFLRTKERKFWSAFIGRWGILFVYGFASLMLISLILGQHGPVSNIDMFTALFVSIGVSMFLWGFLMYILTKSNHVVFLSEKPSLYSKLISFYARNKSIIEKGLIGLAFTILGAIVYILSHGLPHL